MSKFKPEFGNVDHIYIVEQITQLNKDKKLYDEYIAKNKDIKVLKKKITERRKRIKHLIEIASKKPR